MKLILWLGCATMIAMPNALAQQVDPPPVPPRSDRQFVVDSGPGIDVRNCGQSLHVEIPIDRYVGVTNSDGTLRDANALIAEGSLQAWVELEIAAFDIDYDNYDHCTAERDNVFF